MFTTIGVCLHSQINGEFTHLSWKVQAAMTELLDTPDNVKIRSPWAQLGLFLRWIGIGFLGLVVLSLIFNLLPAPIAQSLHHGKTHPTDQYGRFVWRPGFFLRQDGLHPRPLHYLGFRKADHRKLLRAGNSAPSLCLPPGSLAGSRQSPYPPSALDDRIRRRERQRSDPTADGKKFLRYFFQSHRRRHHPGHLRRNVLPGRPAVAADPSDTKALAGHPHLGRHLFGDAFSVPGLPAPVLSRHPCWDYLIGTAAASGQPSWRIACSMGYRCWR